MNLDFSSIKPRPENYWIHSDNTHLQFLRVNKLQFNLDFEPQRELFKEKESHVLFEQKESHAVTRFRILKCSYQISDVVCLEKNDQLLDAVDGFSVDRVSIPLEKEKHFERIFYDEQDKSFTLQFKPDSKSKINYLFGGQLVSFNGRKKDGILFIFKSLSPSE